MAEPASRVKQPSQHHGPSQLRNEITSEHTDGDQHSEYDPVQVPDSQVVIRETQFDDYPEEVPNGELPLSPNSAAVVQLHGANNTEITNEVTSFNPLTRPTETKEAFQSQSSFPSPLSVGFMFGQPRKLSMKPQYQAPQPPSESSGGKHVEAHHETAERLPKGTKPTAVADILPQRLVESEQDLVGKAPIVSLSVQHGVDDVVKQVQQRDEFLKVISDTPPSAQPSVTVAKRHGVAKKGKKGKMALKQQQRGVPWPPRPSVVSAHVTVPSSNIETGFGKPPAVQMALSLPTDDRATQLRPPSVIELEPQHDIHRVTELVDSHLPPDAILIHPTTPRNKLEENSWDGRRDMRTGSEALQERASEHGPDMATFLPNNRPATSIKHLPTAEPTIRAYPESTLPLPGADEGRNEAAASQSKSKCIVIEHPEHPELPHWGCDVEPVRVVNPKDRDCGHDTKDVDDDEPWPVRNTAGSGGHSQNTASHGLPAQQRPHRIQKTQKKKQPSTLSQPPKAATFLHQFATAPSDFDQTLQTLRAAYCAEQNRREQEAATHAKHSDEVKGLLQDQVNRYSASAADWKDKYDMLHVNMVHLREKAKTNQKYVSGLQKDHEKLRKSTTILQEDCKKALQQKISEVEHEKKLLQQELEKTLGVVEKGQNRLRKMVDDLYSHLIISQSKRRDLAENLTKQTAMYETEKTKRNDLENRLLASVQGVQRQLGNHTTIMAEKIGTLQGSIDGIDARVKQESGVQKCLETLQKIQDTPFLTVKDVRKAEDMLRFVHEGVCSKLDALAQSNQSNIDPMEEFRSFIGDQLKTLRSDMLKYDEVVAESRKAQELNDALGQQLLAEQQHTQQINEQLSGFRRHEEELQVRMTQLERQLVEARDKTKKVSALEQNIEELRQQVKAVQDECKAAKAELERTERNLQKRDRKEADYKKSIEILKGEIQRLELENNAKASTTAELRKKIEEQLRQEFATSESVFRNDIHRLTNERDEGVTKIQGHNKIMEAAKARCEEAKRRTEEIRSELEAARKEKQETESRLDTMQREAQNDSGAASELTKLKERLRQKIEELQAISGGLRRLETAFAEMESSKADLQVMCEQQQFEISQHSSAIESLRHETEVERGEEREKHNAAIKLAQDQNQALIEEKGKMQEVLEQTRSNESKLSNALADLIVERDGLKRRTAELEQAKSVAETQFTKAQQESNNLVHRHEEELEDLRRRHESTDTALKGAEAKVHLQKIEHSKKIEFDLQKYKAKYQALTEELKKEKAKTREASSGDVQQLPAPANVQCPPSHLIDISRPSKSRKKVNRENQSVLNVVGLSSTLVNTAAREASTARESPGSKGHASAHLSENLFDASGSISGGDELLEDHGLSIIDPAAEQVEDTQIIADVMIPLGEYAEEARNTTGSSIPADQSSLSEPLASDELAQLFDENWAVHTPKQRKRRSRLLSGRSPEERVLETPLRKKNVHMSVFRPSQSQERPKSQANTASRMMPPPGSILYHIGQDKSSPHASAKAADRRRTYRKPQYDSYGNNSTASGSVRQPSSMTRSMPTGLIDPRILDDNSSSPSAHQQSQKRGGAFDQNGPSKRQRQSSPYFRAEPSSAEGSLSSHQFPSKGSRSSDVDTFSRKNQTSPAGSSRSQALGSRTKAQDSSSKVALRPLDRTSPYGRDFKSCDHRSSTSRSSAIVRAPRYYGRHQTRSKTQEAERFNQEIRGR